MLGVGTLPGTMGRFPVRLVAFVLLIFVLAILLGQLRYTGNTITALTRRYTGHTSQPERAPFINILTSIPMIDNPCDKTAAKYANAHMMKTRVKEYRESLDSNLNHSLVEAVYVRCPCDIKVCMEYTAKMALHRADKLHHVAGNGIVRYVDTFQYAMEHLKNKVAITMNADVSIGEGFQKINATFLRDSKVVYALTRTSLRKSPTCVESVGCQDPYRISHDAFVFVPTFDLPKEAADLMDFTQNDNGAENVCIEVLTRALKYRVLNPCKHLALKHHHCSGYRPVTRRRINWNMVKKYAGYNGRVPYSGLYD